MANSDSPPGSPLSEHGSDEFEDDVKLNEGDDLDEEDDDIDLPHMPPTKKLKTGAGAFRATTPPPGDLLDGDISSDTEGEAPSSPGPPGQQPEEEADQQVTVCRWRACQAGDLGNMDELVRHIHDVHIGSRQKKYACEWEGCSRIDATHASGYALRAHMRSHTREKPFYCALPECDKSFTRSDALAKHMRTVHETEALRPSDPVPRYHSSTSKQPKLKLIFNKGRSADGSSNGAQLAPDEQAIQYVINNSGYPASCEFSQEELALTSKQLYDRLRLFARFTEEEGENLKAECERLEQLRHEEWKKKELVLLNVIEGTLAVEVASSLADEGRPDRRMASANDIVGSLLPAEPLPMQKEEQCFWRRQDEGSIASVETDAVANGVKSETDVEKN